MLGLDDVEVTMMDDVDATLEQIKDRLAAVDPKVVLALTAIALCAGIWLGFKLAGGTVAEAPCAPCEDRRTEAEILDADPAE